MLDRITLGGYYRNQVIHMGFYRLILIGATCLALSGETVFAECYDPDQRCTSPCPVQNPCVSHDECQPGWLCNLSARIPVFCGCSPSGAWGCYPARVGQCVEMRDPLEPANYTIIDLGTLGGASANAASINNYGEVVGEADILGGTRHAFHWYEGTITDLGYSLPGPWSSAQDINHFGEIIILNGESKSLVWDN